MGSVVVGEVCAEYHLLPAPLTKSSVGPVLWLATFYQYKMFTVQKGCHGESDGAEGEDGARVGDFSCGK